MEDELFGEEIRLQNLRELEEQDNLRNVGQKMELE